MTTDSRSSDTGGNDSVASLLSLATRAFLVLGIVADLVFCSIPFLPGLPTLFFAGYAWVHFLIRVGTMITFLAWLYLRYSAIPSLGWPSTNLRPAAAIGWFFVPIANLVKPYHVVQELWVATEDDRAGSLERSPVVLAWWLAFVSAPIAWFFMGPSLYASPTIRGGAKAILTVSVLNIVAAVLATRVIQEIELRWRSRRSVQLDPNHGWDVIDDESPDESTATISENEPAPPVPPVPTAPASAMPPARKVQHEKAESPRPSPQGEASVPPAIAARRASMTPSSGTNVPSPANRSVSARAPVGQGMAPPAVAPASTVSGEEDIATLVELLPSLRRAAIALAMLGIVSVVLIVGGGGYFLWLSQSGGELMRHLAIAIFLLYLGMGLMYLVPITHQLRFAAAARRFATSKSAADLETALRLQGRFWAFTGGLIAIFLTIEIVAIVAAIVIPNLMRVL